MTRGALIGLLALSAMWWLPPLLDRLDRRPRPRPDHSPPTHVTPTQVRIRGTLLRPSRELDRGDR